MRSNHIIKYLFKSAALLLSLIPILVTAESLTIVGSGTDLGTFKLLAERFTYKYPDVQIHILPSIGSGGSIRALNKNDIDIALLSRPPKDSEKKSHITFLHYATTPLVFAVHINFEIENVTSQQIAAFYSGTETQWNNGTPVRPILRPKHDSDTLLINAQLNITDEKNMAHSRKGLPVALSDQDAADMIATVNGAFGPSTLALILAEKRPLKALSLDGIAANPSNLQQGKYPLHKPLYMAYANNNTKQYLEKFISFLQSKEGQDILNSTGHIVSSQ